MTPPSEINCLEWNTRMKARNTTKFEGRTSLFFCPKFFCLNPLVPAAGRTGYYRVTRIIPDERACVTSVWPMGNEQTA